MTFILTPKPSLHCDIALFQRAIVTFAIVPEKVVILLPVPFIRGLPVSHWQRSGVAAE